MICPIAGSLTDTNAAGEVGHIGSHAMGTDLEVVDDNFRTSCATTGKSRKFLQNPDGSAVDTGSNDAKSNVAFRGE